MRSNLLQLAAEATFVEFCEELFGGEVAVDFHNGGTFHSVCCGNSCGGFGCFVERVNALATAEMNAFDGSGFDLSVSNHWGFGTSAVVASINERSDGLLCIGFILSSDGNGGLVRYCRSACHFGHSSNNAVVTLFAAVVNTSKGDGGFSAGVKTKRKNDEGECSEEFCFHVRRYLKEP